MHVLTCIICIHQLKKKITEKAPQIPYIVVHLHVKFRLILTYNKGDVALNFESGPSDGILMFFLVKIKSDLYNLYGSGERNKSLKIPEDYVKLLIVILHAATVKFDHPLT